MASRFDRMVVVVVCGGALRRHLVVARMITWSLLTAGTPSALQLLH
jgi:hypothetical protein